MVDRTDSGSSMQLLLEMSFERFLSTSYHSLPSPADVSRTSCLDVDVAGTLSEDCCNSWGKWVESSRSSGGAWPLAIRLVTSLATEK